MKLALKLNPLNDSDVLFAQQIGVSHIIGDLPDWDTRTLAYAANRVKQGGLSLSALDCLPGDLLHAAFADSPEREPALERICGIITEMGRLGIRSLGYRYPLPFAAAELSTVLVRGEAMSTVYPAQPGQAVHAPVETETIWQALTAFLQRVLPVAEQAGVRLAYQTDPSLLALPADQRFPNSIADLDKLFGIAPSANHGLDVDYGYLSQVLAQGNTGLAVEAIRRFVSMDRVVTLRLRTLQQTTAGIKELFLDEDKAAIVAVLQASRDAGYNGLLCPVAAPEMTDDSGWRHKGHAFGTGYLKGLLQVLA